MKCNNCGANFQTDELQCPYCGSRNIVGEEWQRERNLSQNFYEEMKRNFYEHGVLYVIDKVLNKALLLLFVAFIIVFILYMFPSMVEEGILDIKKAILKDQIIGQMEEYHQSGEWDKLEVYMSEYDMFEKENYVYCQAAIMERYYQDYMQEFMQYIELPEEEQEEGDYYIERFLRDSRDLYRADCGIYDDLRSANKEKHEQYKEEVLIFWKVSLGLTEEEIQFLIEEDYLYMEDEERYVEIIKERKAWK